MKSNPMPRGFRFAAQARASAWLASLGLLSAFVPQAAQAQAVIDNAICQTASTLNCTANDVPLANVTAIIVDPNTGTPLADQTCVAGQTISIKMTANTLSGASKYDVGLLFSAQNVCQGLFLDQGAPGDPSPPANDICGDATQENTAVPLHPVSGGTFPNATPSSDIITIPCQADSSGNLAINGATVTWHTGGDNLVCNGQPATYFIPQAGSKCRRQDLPLGNGVRGTITVIKQTLPDGLSDSFAFTAAAANGSLKDPADASFNLIDNGSHVVETAPLTGTPNNHTIDENLSPAQIAAGWVTSSIACVYTGTATPVANATVNLANGTAVLPMLGNQPHITCTYTNTRPPQLHLRKALGGTGRANAADQFTMNIDATTATTGGSGTTVTGGQVDVIGTAGQSYAFGEIMAGGSVSVLGQYDSAYACVNATQGSNTVMPAGAGSGFNLTPAAGDDITCTITNTPKAATVILRKALDALGRANAADQFAMTITGTGGGSANTSGAGSTVTGGVVTVNPATLDESYTLSEAMAAGSVSPLSNYTSSIACSNGRAGAPATTLPSGAGISFNVTPQAGDAIDCTITNVRKTGTVTVVKALSPNTDAGVFNLQINGNTVASNVGDGGSGNTANVPTGSTVNVAELAGTATLLANYTSSLSCVGVAGVTGTTSGSFSMPAGNVTCTFTNTRKTHTVTVVKSLAPTTDAGRFDLSINGNVVAPAAGNGGSGNVALPVGSSVTVAEVAAANPATNLANYTSSLSCTGVAGVTGTTSGGFTMPDADVVCTFTNTRRSAQLTLRKTWQNAKVADAVTITGTGSVNALSLNAVAGAANETDTGSAVTVYAGETISLSEVFTTGVDADYTKTLSCTGAADGNANDGLNIGPNDTAITCTFTNARNSNTVTVIKALNPTTDAGRFDLSINGNVVASAVGNAGQGALPVLIGDQVTVAEVAANGTTGSNYTSSLSCVGVAGVTGTTSGSFSMPAGNVTCTFTNTRKTHTLRVQKSLSPVSDAGQFVMNANGTDGAAGGDGAFSTAVVAVGASATFGETAAQGTDLANYTSSYSCSDDTSGQGTSGSIASMPDADVTCTITNTRKSAQLTLRKTWQNAKIDDAVTITGTGSVNALSLNAVAGAANETDTGSAVTVYAGETISFSETFTTGVDADYTKTLACTGAADGNANDGLSIGPNDTAITCTYTNARLSGTVTVVKALSPSSDTGTFDLSINGNVVAAAVGDGGTSAAVPVLIGDQVTVAETAANGTTGANYTSSLSCTGVNGVSGTTSGSFTMPAGNVVCTFTNRRNPGRLTLVKQLPGRVAAADQFTVSVSDGESTVASATTAGTDTSATTGATSLAPGAYTLIDAPLQANPSPADYYAASLACTNAAEGSATVLPSGSGTSFPLNLQSGDDITCTYTNTPIPPEVTVAKVLSAGGPTASPGETLTYTITLTNSGGAAATNHAFYESIPAHTSFVAVNGASVSGCVAGDAGRKTCTLTVAGPIAGNGGTANVTLQVKVADALPAGLLNLYNLVTDNTSNPPPACNPATDENECRNPPPTCDVAEDPTHCVATPIAPIFTVLKEVTGPAIPGEGDYSYVVNYRITVNNQGGSSGTYDLIDTPKFGAGTTITGISALRDGTTVAGLSGIGPWTLADDLALAAGAQDVYTLSVTVQVTPGAPLPSDTCVANTPNNGYFNTATLNVASGELESNACTDTPRPVTPVVALQIEKLGSTRVAEIGDLVSYSVRIRNTGNAAAIMPVLVDRLPPGFRLIDEGTRVVGANLVSLQGAPGPVLQFTLDSVPAGAEVRVLYRVRLGVGSREGNGINTAQVECGSASARAACSNMSQWKVEVTAGIFHDEGCIAGQVFIDCNRNSVKDPEEIGIPGVRMYMEDGTFLVSDVQGKYSLCGILPKTHVIAVDQTTLPRGSRLTTSSSRNAGDAGSLFVDLKKGELFRADFIEGSCSNGVLEQTKARQANGEVRSVETEPNQPKLQFESKPATAPQEATDSANQQIEQSRHKPE